MADDPCSGWYDEWKNQEICSVLQDTQKLGSEFEGAAKKLRILADATTDRAGARKLRRAADTLDSAAAKLGASKKATTAITYFSKVKSFHDSYKKITPDLIETDTDAAVKEFANLLNVGGDLIEALCPPPIDSFGGVLKEAAKGLGDVVDALIPSRRQGAAWDQYRKAMRGDVVR